MGVDRLLLPLVLQELARWLGPLPSLHFCELGNQQIGKAALSFLLERGYRPDAEDVVSLLKSLHWTPASRLTTVKKFLRALGVRHTSLDWNEEDGAVAADLSRPLGLTSSNDSSTSSAFLQSLLGTCDAVTDFGTAEHVGEESLERDGTVLRPQTVWRAQYELFRNVHALTREGGLMLHSLPLAGCWPGHGIVEYEPAFFNALAHAAGYTAVNVSVSRPSHDWTTEQAETFWHLAQERLGAGWTGELELMRQAPVPKHDASCQGLVQAVLIRRRGPFIDAKTFAGLPGIRIKTAVSDGDPPRVCAGQLCVTSS
eukprot:TRINITY_DN54535_c0_g1_i1.p1 TRINITY_DN54535_c0_g1~~TRINITY_DN54535_c0_g1_i1.p1  ORF type:complete len:340 (+),score=80.42 TRINITY_DN54535_c0_g1_i1:84-1022(+)